MIILGEYTSIPENEIEIYLQDIHNFTSPLNDDRVDRLNLLPPMGIDYTFNQQFDLAYYEYILNNDQAFMEFMSKIIIPEYTNRNVFIIVRYGEGFDYLNEAFTKMIQARYGIICSYIYSKEDLLYLNDNTDLSFNIFGLSNLDMDLERYRYLIEKYNPGYIEQLENKDD